MINIQKLIEEANENGYQGDKASAKVCQDIVLKALSIGPLSSVCLGQNKIALKH